MPHLLTVSQLAEYLTISPRTIYNLVSSRRIPFVKAGGALRFVGGDIEKWLLKSSCCNKKEEQNGTKSILKNQEYSLIRGRN